MGCVSPTPTPSFVLKDLMAVSTWAPLKGGGGGLGEQTFVALSHGLPSVFHTSSATLQIVAHSWPTLSNSASGPTDAPTRLLGAGFHKATSFVHECSIPAALAPVQCDRLDTLLLWFTQPQSAQTATLLAASWMACKVAHAARNSNLSLVRASRIICQDSLKDSAKTLPISLPLATTFLTPVCGFCQ